MDGGALVVTVLIAGQGGACACARSNDVDILGLDRSDLEAAAFNDRKYRHHNQHTLPKRN